VLSLSQNAECTTRAGNLVSLSAAAQMTPSS
jgi:hypothetical protein